MAKRSIVRQIEVGMLQNFSYLLGCIETKEAALIDPAWEEKKLYAALKADQLKLTCIYLTHTHFDHIEAVDRVLCRYPKAKVIVHEKEAKRLISEKGIIPFQYLKGGETLSLGRLQVKAIHTPGHQPGGISYYVEDMVFTGDTLFIGRCGRVDFEGGSPEEMWESLQLLKTLPDTCLLMPGHHYGRVPSRLLGEEKQHNLFLKAQSFRDFAALCDKVLPKS